MANRPSDAAAAAASGGATMCDDVLRSILARAPARTAIACTALSRHHGALIRCADFRALHCLLAPPLPRPHIAYVATAELRRSSVYHGFHVAGAGLSGGTSSITAPMRALSGATFIGKEYVNSCHGVVLLAGGHAPNKCVLWNPAVADEEKEVAVPVLASHDCVILGLGYGRRSNTYKLLLSQRLRKRTRTLMMQHPSSDIDRHRPKELLVYALGGAGEQPRLRSVSSREVDGQNISGKSLYMDGTIYLLQADNPEILAFDVDEETVTAIDLPGDRNPAWLRRCILLELYGRPCVEKQDSDGGRALWLLTAEHRWEQRCVVEAPFSGRVDDLGRHSIAGVWDCGGVLVMYLQRSRDDDDDKLCLFDVASNRMLLKANLPRSVTPERSGYKLCWGYRPTLVSPRSIVAGGEFSQGEERRRARAAEIMDALKPVDERDRRKGHKATLGTRCFMEFLVRIMLQLPDNMKDVMEMPLLKSEDAYSSFSNRRYSYDSDLDSELIF